jgi:hypothetical protein
MTWAAQHDGLDPHLMQRPAAERIREFRALARDAREEASRASADIQTSFLRIAEEWDYLAEEAEKEARGAA